MESTARAALLALVAAGCSGEGAVPRDETPPSAPASKDEALVLARKHLATLSAPAELVLDEAGASEHAFGWVFPATTRRHLETRDVRDMIPGLGSIAVQRDGTVVSLPTSVAPSRAIEELERRWKAAHP